MLAEPPPFFGENLLNRCTGGSPHWCSAGPSLALRSCLRPLVLLEPKGYPFLQLLLRWKSGFSAATPKTINHGFAVVSAVSLTAESDCDEHERTVVSSCLVLPLLSGRSNEGPGRGPLLQLRRISQGHAPEIIKSGTGSNPLTLFFFPGDRLQRRSDVQIQD